GDRGGHVERRDAVREPGRGGEVRLVLGRDGELVAVGRARVGGAQAAQRRRAVVADVAGEAGGGRRRARAAAERAVYGVAADGRAVAVHADPGDGRRLRYARGDGGGDGAEGGRVAERRERGLHARAGERGVVGLERERVQRPVGQARDGRRGGGG